MALLKCPECGHNVSDLAEICLKCGYPVSKIKEAIAEQEAAMQAPKICRQCGHEIHTGTGICGHCGAFPGMAHAPRQKSIISKENLGTLWRGEISLVKTFWVYYSAIPLLIGIFFALFLKNLILRSISQGDLMPLFIFRLFQLLVLCPYNIIVNVGLWRSSNHYMGSNVWRILAKLWVILAVVFTPYGIWAGLKMFKF